MEKRKRAAVGAALADLYDRYNKKEYVSPDPLQFLYDYGDARDREVAGLVASALAYGKVAQILKSVEKVLSRMGPSPRDFVDGAAPASLKRHFKDFKHRFTTGDDLSDMLAGARRAIKKRGSLEACFVSGFSDTDETALPALAHFVEELGGGSLLPSPAKGSACKRLNLYLRWMVRRDDVDPGGWEGVPPSKLVVPLDTHIHRFGLALALTDRRQADIKTALEITAAFRDICPEDPVKYDFALTRLGIRDDMDLGGFLEKMKKKINH